ncbi:hypothetical protein ACET3X_005644 [Alternaria dauci]|uniref:Amino-acid N-acetyltransferase subunit Mak10 n=1 Tax=Alternaria dauci TaxID=48095 RepID=A0ABR3UFY9_9PLEO
MAEDAIHSHNNSTGPAAHARYEVDGAGPSHAAAQESAPTVQPPTSANLSLRQSRVQPKIHDVTDKFTRACNALEVGQLVKDEYFTLFESIGAIEIMDPKMDSGFLLPGETLEDDYDTLSPLLPEELIGIMDQLLCYEMAWHTGYPLSQTLFTSVYIDKLLWPETKILSQAQFFRGDVPDGKRPGPLLEVLRAYCLAVIKGCDFVIAKITGRDYFEEEDFCTHTYNRVLFVSVPMDVFLRELDAAMETVADPALVDINDALRHAIVSRLELRKYLLRALDLDLALDQISYSWPPVLENIDRIKTTHQLGKFVPGAFSPKMQRRLASTVPPRPIVDLSFADAIEKLTQLATDCHESTRFPFLPHDPLEYQAFLWHFSSRTPAPLTYARSYLSTLLFHPDVLDTSVSLPLADVKSLVLTASPVLDPMNWTLSPPRNALLPKPPRLMFAMLVDEFVERAGQAYLDLWVAVSQNRCRADAGSIDADIATAAAQLGGGVERRVMEFGLSTWVYHKKLWMVEKVVLLGFEQDIYLRDEYAGMYLFLGLIATRRKELLQRVDAHSSALSSSFRKEKRFADVQDVQDATPLLESLLAEATGTAELALALARFYIIALYLRKLPLPRRSSLSTNKLRYEVRMKPFLALSPPEAPPFEDFEAHSLPYGPVLDPPPAAFVKDVQNMDSVLWTELDGHVNAAKAAFVEYKSPD